MPAADRDLSKLHATFRRKLEAVLNDLAGHGLTLFVTEGFRSVERQLWLYAQGRTRKGPLVTRCDGVLNRSAHQSGKAADVAFRGGKLYPPGNSPAWKLLASAAKAHGLEWGGTWKFKDRPHLQLPSSRAATHPRARPKCPQTLQNKGSERTPADFPARRKISNPNPSPRGRGAGVRG